jgi:hypothetical protein
MLPWFMPVMGIAGSSLQVPWHFNRASCGIEAASGPIFSGEDVMRLKRLASDDAAADDTRVPEPSAASLSDFHQRLFKA